MSLRLHRSQLVVGALLLVACPFDPEPPVDSPLETAGDTSSGSGDPSTGSDETSTGSADGASSESTAGTEPQCGDGIVDATEDCDDMGESATCDADCTAATCGDGTINAAAGEACEDMGESATCDADCTVAACGDGTTNAAAGEACDDAGESATCDVDCTAATCGDGTINMAVGEACDDTSESATCDADCTAVECGDGLVNAVAGEECDDGMPPAGGDGCSATCQLEVPSVCDAGFDALSGDPWVVCSADANQAWVAHGTPAGGSYHPQLICAELGYATFGQFGGTCGNVCGYCEGATSCMAPGMQTFDGGGDCGMDGGGLVLCVTVMWQCINP